MAPYDSAGPGAARTGGDPMRTSSRTRLLGRVCVVCGALVAVAGFLLDSQAAGAVTADTATARFANGLFGVAVLGLMGGVLGLWSLRVGGSGWLPRAATVVALVGSAPVDGRRFVPDHGRLGRPGPHAGGRPCI